MTNDSQHPTRYINYAAMTWDERKRLVKRPPYYSPLCFQFCYHAGDQIISLGEDRQQERCRHWGCRCPCHAPSVQHVFTYAQWEAILLVRQHIAEHPADEWEVQP